MFKRLGAFLYLRQLTRTLGQIALALDAQTQILERLAEKFAPLPSAPDRQTVSSETGLSFLDDTDAGHALAYIERTRRDTGHVPDDEEILMHLADEKTTDLHKRLVARDEELARLQAERRW